MGFTKDEQKVLDKLVEAHKLYVELRKTHPSDIKE